MSSHVTKIKDLVSKVTLTNGLSRIFNLHVEPLHYTSAKYPYNETLYQKDKQIVDYILYHHPISCIWKVPHPSNKKTSQPTNSLEK